MIRIYALQCHHAQRTLLFYGTLDILYVQKNFRKFNRQSDNITLLFVMFTINSNDHE